VSPNLREQISLICLLWILKISQPKYVFFFILVTVLTGSSGARQRSAVVKLESGVQSAQITTVHKTRLLMVATRLSVNELFLKFEVIC
jgi:hypothetical protein